MSITVAELKAAIAAIPDTLDDHIVIIDGNHSDTCMVEGYSAGYWEPEEDNCYGTFWTADDVREEGVDPDTVVSCITLGGTC